ncbi:MAG: alkaline phosphatase family protein [Bryobacterales bacterium]|nr:alkaline phosphatase family protein [Bryobacterales bacterium]
MKPLVLLLAFAALAAAQPRPKHIIVIGLDGFGAQALQFDAKAPNLRALMAAGSWTLKARGVMPTVSSPNWASLIMGAGPEQHGITSNDWQPDKFEFSPSCQGMAQTFPTIFGLLRQQRPSAHIAIVHDWEGFGRMVEKAAPTFIRHVKGSPPATQAAIAYWKEHKPELLFLHLDDVDHAGHDHGWWGPEYKAAVEMVDGLIGQFREAAGRDATFLITADHGGNARKHGGNTMGELEIPWILSGPGIRRGELTVPVNTFDTAATLAALLRLKPPACWIGQPVESSWR